MMNSTVPVGSDKGNHEELLKQYIKEIQLTKELGVEWEMSEKEIESAMKEALNDTFTNIEDRNTRRFYFHPVYLLCRAITVGCIIVCFTVIMFMYKKPFLNIVERNVQEIIYPGMKLFRKLMLPVIETFPTLTELYDENCLIHNPYFQVSDMDCWPCNGVRSVLNLTGSNLSSEESHYGIPFIYKEEMRYVAFVDLQNMYNRNKDMFDLQSPRLESSHENIWKSVEDLFLEHRIDHKSTNDKDAHIIWRLNRLDTIRAARHLFGYPKQIPHYVAGATPQKFIIIDESNASPYALPSTEGSTVFVVQGSGSRLFVLDPAPECQSNCTRVSLLLHPHHILWYNWWYWRASSFPLLTSDDISITYLGSYH